jgi:hypothetical protein
MTDRKWMPIETAPRDGQVFEARCGLYPPMDAYFTGWTFVFNDEDEGEIAYGFTHWRPKQ